MWYKIISVVFYSSCKRQKAMLSHEFYFSGENFLIEITSNSGKISKSKVQ